MLDNFKKILDFIRELYDQPTGSIALHEPVFMGNEKKYLDECVDSTFVSSVGAYVDKFESDMATYTGAKKAVTCVNGTNALFLALKLVGVDYEHEVITQPLTFVATANAIIYCGAQPVFIDVDLDTMGLSPKALSDFLSYNTHYDPVRQKQINKNTQKPISACLPMHTFGHPARIDEIVEICNQFHIPVIEDAAESVGTLYKARHTGTYGIIGVLSFNGNKIITTGGGGMLLFKDEVLAKKAKHLTTQAKVPHPWEYVHDEIGYNFRMPNINAALGLAQLEQLEKFVSSKRNIAKEYRNFFTETAISFIDEPENARSNYWLNCILLRDQDERDELLRLANSSGVMMRPIWQLMHHLKMFRNCYSEKTPNAEYLAQRLVNLPSSVKLVAGNRQS